MGTMWSSTHQTTPQSGAMLERAPAAEKLNQLKEENSSLKKTTNHQEDTIRQLKTKLSRVIALAKRSTADPNTVSQIKFHEETLAIPNGTSTPQQQTFASSNNHHHHHTDYQPQPQQYRSMSALPRARSASRGRALSARPKVISNSEGLSLTLLEEAHNEICSLKASVSRREEEVHEWETVAQKLNSELSSERKLRSDAEQELCRTRVSLVKANKEIQLRDSQIEALEAKIEANRLIQEKFDSQNARILELEESLARKETHSVIVQELQQRIAEIERERDIVQESNRKLVEQSEELKERVAATTRTNETQDDEQGVLQDMLLQLQDKFEALEKHIDKVVTEAKTKNTSNKATSKERHRKSLNLHKKDLDKMNGIYETTQKKILHEKNSSPPQPKPRRKSLVNERMSTSSSRESLDSDNRDSLLDKSSERKSRLNKVNSRNPAILRNEATQTSQPQESSRVNQVTKILSSDDSISEVTETSLMAVNAPLFEIHIDKARLPQPPKKSAGVVVNWELADFEMQSTPVGHLCEKDLLFNCTARYILESIDQIKLQTTLRLFLTSVDGRVLGECLIEDVGEAVEDPGQRKSYSAELTLNRKSVGTLDLWLRYVPKPK